MTAGLAVEAVDVLREEAGEAAGALEAGSAWCAALGSKARNRAHPRTLRAQSRAPRRRISHDARCWIGMRAFARVSG